MKIYVKTSLQHGKGVFALKPIRKGEAVITFSGPRVHRTQLDSSDYHLQIAADYYLGASGREDDYVNHSCAPNSGFQGGLTLVALRDVEKGEEITWDYSTAIDEEDFSGFPCRCGAPVCRGAVVSFRYLPPDEQLRLQSWLLPYLQEKYFPGLLLRSG
ncbi:MAG TPA: SET domain-containing protein-lysine N-methyltransferase [Acidiferrobacterales bacterium]|nr:SET domain-containing protein-lysine N-methyltransferase [Acidiferrobacterales bacterium]